MIAPRLIGQPEGEWIEVLAGRIRALPDRRLWVFASNYPEPYRSGHLVERLFARLKATETEAGFPVTQGLSTLYRVALP